tara:strand:+ start:5080 stop:5547 length:468 start_codon:yes stop_codon:yes gene_type:complete
MIFPTLLALHSLVRWLVLISLIFILFTSIFGLSSKQPFTQKHNWLRMIAVSIAHLQLILGIWLYSISPLIQYFWQNFGEAVHERFPRFFGMEHSLVMTIAVVLITIGSAKAKRKTTDLEKHKTLLIWMGIALFLILTSIPWSFSPLTSRPLFRSF